MTIPHVGGRKKIERDPKVAQQVQLMAGYGNTVLQIAQIVGISQPIINRLYTAELERGRILADTQVVASLFKMATHPTKPVVVAAIWWTKARMGWSENGNEMGKKETADALSKAAEAGTKWEGLLEGED